MKEIKPATAIGMGLGQTFLGPLWLMLGLPAFGLRPGYWACFFIFAAAETFASGFALALRMRHS